MGKMIQKWDAAGLVKHIRKDLLPGHLQAAGERVLAIARAEIDKPKHGRTYFSKGARRNYRASAPGEALASPTGKVRKNLEVEVGQQGNGPAVRIGPNKSVAGVVKRLTFGNRNTAPRPTLEPALENNRSAVEEALKAGR